MNQVSLIGNLATDVELKKIDDEKQVASFLLAVDRPTSDDAADFIRITTWNKQAELCERCGRSGRLDAVRCPACRPRGVRAAHVVSVEDPTATLRLGNEAIAGATVAESPS